MAKDKIPYQQFGKGPWWQHNDSKELAWFISSRKIGSPTMSALVIKCPDNTLLHQIWLCCSTQDWTAVAEVSTTPFSAKVTSWVISEKKPEKTPPILLCSLLHISQYQVLFLKNIKSDKTFFKAECQYSSLLCNCQFWAFKLYRMYLVSKMIATRVNKN